MKILSAYLVERPYNAALQDRPETFDCVRVDRADDMLANTVIDGLMGEAVFQPQVAGISVGAEKANAVRYGLPRESFQCKPIGPLNDTSDDVALTFDGTNNRSLAGVATAPRSASLVPIPVLVAAADVGFIDLDDAAQFLDVLDHRSSDLVAHEPSGLVAPEAHVAEDLEGAHALVAD